MENILATTKGHSSSSYHRIVGICGIIVQSKHLVSTSTGSLCKLNIDEPRSSLNAAKGQAARCSLSRPVLFGFIEIGVVGAFISRG